MPRSLRRRDVVACGAQRPPEELLARLRRVVVQPTKPDITWTPRVGPIVQPTAGRVTTRPEPVAGLTSEELDIFRLSDEGHSSKQIARIFGVTEYIVHETQQRVARKLDAVERKRRPRDELRE